MTFIDFFAGIGGFRLGMELAGHRCIGFCEYDKFATASYTSMHLATDEQREYLATLPLKERQKEILKEEYRNGEWYANDIRNVISGSIPKADCWCFGAPCQSFSIAGKRAGLEGESGLIREIFRLLRKEGEEHRPEWLIYENVKGMFSSNRGFDYLAILSEMDELGYDVEWQLFNSKDWGVPQNRERVYTVGHLRRCGLAKIFPLEEADGEDNAGIRQIGKIASEKRDNPNRYRVYSVDGQSPTLNNMQGGGREPYIAIPINITGSLDVNRHSHIDVLGTDGICSTLDTMHERKKVAVIIPPDNLETNRLFNQKDVVHSLTGISRTLIGSGGDRGYGSGNQPKVAIHVDIGSIEKIIDRQGRLSKAVKMQNIVPTIKAQMHGNIPEVVILVLTPDRINKRQNGRRFKDDGDPAFTLTSIDRHGVAIGIGVGETNPRHPGIYVQLPGDVTAYAVWYEKYGCHIVIRRLTPRECFRLQGWADEYFNKAAFVNSDSQLYKQAGNGVTVDVVEAVGRAITEVMKDAEKG